MATIIRPMQRYGLLFIFFAIALAFRSWSLVLAITLTLFVFLRHRSNQKENEKRPNLSEEEKEAIIESWQPEPLVPEHDQSTHKPRVIEGKVLKYLEIDGKNCLNMGTADFLSLIGNEQIEEVARKTIAKYGVGSCGPRNFYGTVDVHLDLEKQLATFLECEETILYSYGFSTIASAIPAYSKGGDIIFADKCVNFAIQNGLQASKSKIIWFEHNDTEHLETLLTEQEIQDKKNPKKAAQKRRFIVVEGLYAKTATICPLPRLIELKWKYKVRILVDESFSFGVLGKRGKGVTEHFGVNIVDVDLIAASLENVFCTTGGFCAGRSYVIGHQRLSGLGYCFSASLPPLLATAASEALNIIQEQPEILERLRLNAIHLDKTIKSAIKGTQFKLLGVDISPLKHINYQHEKQNVAEQILDTFIDELHQCGIFVTKARYLLQKELFLPKPTVKLMCRSDLTYNEIEELGEKMRAIIEKLPIICG